ncbi:hypothetical protein GMSM_38710 [Geomonas sp. Red276]
MNGGRRHKGIAGLALLLCAGALAAAGPAAAGELQFRPSITAGEEYNDNIFETADGRRTEYTTRVRPGALLNYHAPWLVWDSSYTFDYRHYARKTHGDEQYHYVDLKGNLQLLENFLFVDLADSLKRTTVDVSRDVAQESLLSPQTTQNVASVSPYLLWRPTQHGVLKTGYRFADTRYWEGVGNWQREHGAVAGWEEQVSENTTLNLDYSYSRSKTDLGSYQTHNAMGGFRYAYAANCFIFGRVGNSWQRFDGGIRASNLLWGGGITHDFGKLFVTLDTMVQKADDPLSISTRQVTYSGRIERRFQRGSMGVGGGYSEYYITQTDSLEKRRVNGTWNASYEVAKSLSISAGAGLDHFYQGTSGDSYPYRITGSGGFTWGFFNPETSLSATYSFQSDRTSLQHFSSERRTNRVLMEVRAVF